MESTIIWSMNEYRRRIRWGNVFGEMRQLNELASCERLWIFKCSIDKIFYLSHFHMPYIANMYIIATIFLFWYFISVHNCYPLPLSKLSNGQFSVRMYASRFDLLIVRLIAVHGVNELYDEYQFHCNKTETPEIISSEWCTSWCFSFD